MFFAMNSSHSTLLLNKMFLYSLNSVAIFNPFAILDSLPFPILIQQIH